MTDLTSMTPVEIDTLWAPLSAETSHFFWAIVEGNEAIRKSNDDPRYYDKWSFKHMKSAAERAERQLPQLREQLAEAELAEAPYKVEWDRRGGWTRAYLVVTKGDGHVHRSMSCNTCFPTTHFNWLTQLSGANEQEIVDQAGERACTVCYASAPVELRLDRTTTLFSEDEKRRKAERAEREAKKAAKEAAFPRNEDGTRLVILDHGYRAQPKTDRAVKNILLSAAESLAFYGTSHPSAKEWRFGIETAVEYFARVDRRPTDEVRDEVNAKTAKKAKSGSWTVKAVV